MVEHGCKIIHIDEPVLMRKPQEAMDYGIDDLKACLKGMTFHHYTKRNFIVILIELNLHINTVFLVRIS